MLNTIYIYSFMYICTKKILHKLFANSLRDNLHLQEGKKKKSFWIYDKIFILNLSYTQQ